MGPQQVGVSGVHGSSRVRSRGQKSPNQSYSLEFGGVGFFTPQPEPIQFEHFQVGSGRVFE